MHKYSSFTFKEQSEHFISLLRKNPGNESNQRDFY